jgi:hypothetical protein
MVWRALAVLSGCVLIAMGVAYYLTYEPAPQVRILWRDGLDPARKAALERRFLLVNPAPFEDRLTYDLLDTSPENLRAIRDERDIRDTDNIDREHATIPPQIPYGQSWMWIAYRLPVLRTPGVIRGILLASGAVLALSLVMLFATGRRARSRAAA